MYFHINKQYVDEKKPKEKELKVHKWTDEEKQTIIRYRKYEWEYKRIARKMGAKYSLSQIISVACTLRKKFPGIMDPIR